MIKVSKIYVFVYMHIVIYWLWLKTIINFQDPVPVPVPVEALEIRFRHYPVPAEKVDPVDHWVALSQFLRDPAVHGSLN